MLVIRFFRTGKRNQPSYKIVVANKRNSARGGRFVEEVGFYNPLTKQKVLKDDRIKYWISVGAQPSNTIKNLLISEKITEGEKIDVHKKSKKSAEEGTAQAPAPAAAATQAEAPKEEPKAEPKAEAPKEEQKPATGEAAA